jgi:hypothetical protein
MWHESVHVKRAATKLVFWRFSFGPEYDEARIREEILSIFEENTIRSYVFYEILGEYDVVVRFWLPIDRSLTELERQFDRSLRGEGLKSRQFLRVRRILSHWAWQGCLSPNEEDVAIVDRRHVNQLEQLNTGTLRHFYQDHEASADLAKLYANSPAVDDPPAWLDDFLDRGLIRPLDLERRGVRFFIDFDIPSRGFRNPDEFTQAAESINQACALACAKEYTHGKGTFSIYTGEGSFTNFLVIARAPEGDFYDFVRDVIFGIRNAYPIRLLHIRPYTQVSADRTFRLFRESPSIGRSTAKPAVEQLIGEPETSTLEKKGTLSVNVDRLLAGAGDGPDPALETEVLRAICGLLNSGSRSRGQLVIGILEPERYGSRLAALEKVGATLLQRTQGGGWEVGSAESITGEDPGNIGIVLGVEFEANNGAKAKTTDEYVRRISDLLINRISPNPIGRVVIQPVGLAGRTLISVDVSPGGEEWFYVEGVEGRGKFSFCVRENAGTRTLNGPDVEKFQKAFRRGER